MLTLLPDEILTNLYNYLSIIDSKKLILLDNLFLMLFKNDLANIKKIQYFYKSNRPLLPIENKYTPNYNSLYNKKLLIRHYIAHYPMEFLVYYPEQLINKTQKFELLNWLTENTPKSIHLRTRRHIRSFLLLDNISKNDIFFTGW